MCPEEVPSGCVPCIALQEAAYLLVLWLVPKSLNYIGLDPFMNWGQSTTVFPGNELLFLCGKRALLKCHCGIESLGESPVSAGKPGREGVYRNRPRIYPSTREQGGECCQWVSGLGPGAPSCSFLRKTSCPGGLTPAWTFPGFAWGVVSCLCGGTALAPERFCFHATN